MATTGTTAKIDIEVEARTDAAVENFNKLKKAEADAKAQLVELDKQADKTGKGVDAAGLKSAAGFGRAKDAAKQLAPSLVGVAVAAAQGNVNLGNIAGSALAAAQAFGPWGIAIGVAATALFTLAEANDQATAASVKYRRELALQRDALARTRAEQEFAARMEEDRSARRVELAAVRRGLHETELFLEEEAAAARGAGDAERLSEIQTAQAKARAAQLEQEARDLREIGKIEEANAAGIEAQQVIREDRLRLIEEENRVEESITSHKREQVQLTGEQLALQARVGRRFDARTGRAADDQIAVAGSFDDSSATRFGGELIDPFSKENELQALQQAEEERLAKLEEAKAAAAEAAEQRHEAELKRREEEAEALEATRKRYLDVGEAVGGALGGIAAMSLQAALAGERGFKKTLGAWGKMESIKLAAIALSEGVQAAVSAAMWNIPQAIQHGEAAAQAAATAVIVAGMTGAVGGFGSVSVGSSGNGRGFGFGGSASGADFGGGPGAGPAANSGPTSNSQQDQLPTAGEEAMQQSGMAAMGSAASSGPGTNIHLGPGSITVLGAIDDASALKIAQGLQRVGKNLGKAAA